MADPHDLYALLGIPRDATPEEIRRAYHLVARQLHPDTNTRPGETELFLDIQQAYEVLADPAQRRKYDLGLSSEETRRPGSPLPAALSTVLSAARLPRLDEPQICYALLKIAAREDTPSGAGPGRQGPGYTALNLALVLDRSTSMQGERMDRVKATAVEVVRNLRPEDCLSIITFSDRAEVLLRAGQAPDRKRVEAQIHMIPTGGGTEIYQGLAAAFQEVSRSLSPAKANHILLLTDGRTYGDDSACLELAEQAAALGIGISGFGIGAEWNDEFLDRLASLTGGSCSYISKPEEIRSYVDQKLRSLAGVFAEWVVLHRNPSPGVELRSVFRLAPEPAPLEPGPRIHLGSVPRQAELRVLFEFLVSPLPAAFDRCTLLTARLEVKIPSRSNLPYSERYIIQAPLGQTAPEPPPAELAQVLAAVTLYRLQERAQQELAQGRVEQAGRTMERLATRLVEQGEQELATTILNEAESLRSRQALSEAGKKQMKFGTRLLLLSPGAPGEPR